MSISEAIGKLDAAVDDVNLDIFQLDQSKLSYDGTVVDTKTGARTATWIYADGDTAQEMRISVRHQKDNVRSSKPRQNITIKLQSNVIVTDSGTGISTIGEPAGAFIGFDLPLKGVTVADLRKLIDSVYSLGHASVTSGAPSNGLLTKLAYGTITLYGVGA
jgi:hypothetical protein